MEYEPQPDRKSCHRHYSIEKTLRTIPEWERKDAERFLRLLDLRVKPAVVAHYGVSIRKVSQFLGRPLAGASPDDVARWVALIRKDLNPRTAFFTAGRVRRYVCDLLDCQAPSELPKEWRRVFSLKKPKAPRVGQVMPDEQFEALVAVASDPRYKTVRGRLTAIRNLALYWTLRDGAFRLSECLSLLIRSVKDVGDGLLELTIPEDGVDLKTGARTIYVAKATPALKAWLAVHPYRSDPNSYLFPRLMGDRNAKSAPGQGRRNAGRYGALTTGTVREFFRMHQRHANLRAANGAYYTPHDLRHTCLTEKVVKHGWSTEHLKPFAGWDPESEMASVYVHIGIQEIQARVRADSQRPAASVAPMSAEMLTEALRALLRQHGLGDAAARAP